VTVKEQSECSNYKSTCDNYLKETKNLNKCPGIVIHLVPFINPLSANVGHARHDADGHLQRL